VADEAGVRRRKVQEDRIAGVEELHGRPMSVLSPWRLRAGEMAGPADPLECRVVKLDREALVTGLDGSYVVERMTFEATARMFAVECMVGAGRSGNLHGMTRSTGTVGEGCAGRRPLAEAMAFRACELRVHLKRVVLLHALSVASKICRN
jgi:hypothetical protein